MRLIEVILYQALDIRGRVRVVRIVGVSDGRLPGLVWRWERSVDGVESVLVEGIRHADGAAIKGDDVDILKGDNFRRRDGICSPVPIRRSKVLSCSNPIWLVKLVLLGNVESLALHDLLYDWTIRVGYEIR
jgi:hypothetical protein